MLKIATLNLCLGLPNKKNIIKEMLSENNIDVLCMQEIELVTNMDSSLLSLPGFSFEPETNIFKKRVGVYIKSNINYVRRMDLESDSLHVVVIDVKSASNLRIITVYRPFNPPGNVSAREFFNQQMCQIKKAYTQNTILLGDFNLDWSKKGTHDYAFKHYFDFFDECMNEFNCSQIVEFATWSRVVNGSFRESVLDHVYVPNPCLINNLQRIKPFFGDHHMVTFEITATKSTQKLSINRNWKNYNKLNLCVELGKVDWQLRSDSVQDCWNEFESKLVEVVDKIVPLTEFINNTFAKSKIPPEIKNLMNIRKRLLFKFKTNKCIDIKLKIKHLDKRIRDHFNNEKQKRVRQSVIPGNQGSLWKAVRVANDLNVDQLPNTMYLNNLETDDSCLADSFAKYFDNKIKDILEEVDIDENVYNGKKLVDANNKFFMYKEWILDCLKSLKCKNSEGFDRIPQRILLDGAEILLGPLTTLFSKIYHQKCIPDQWLVAKTIPVFKNKGEKKDVESYRPIANLCSASKIFEKLILKRIMEIQEENNCDITGSNQHGFKRNKSTSTLSLELQSIIARALDEDNFVLVASLDLSSAFDIVNVNLLIKRLKIIGLPSDVIDLIKVWLNNRSYYVSVDGENSVMYDLLLGTVQGSILGPILYAIFVSPLLELELILAFADDNFISKNSKSKELLITDMENALIRISKWFKDSGLKVNNAKTDLCLFYKNDTAPITLTLGIEEIRSNKSMNVLGIVFDSKLTWSLQVSSAIMKATKALNAIKLIRRFFTTNEILKLLTSNFYSILYYNSEIWLIPTITQINKKLLLSASSNALKMAHNYRFPYMSFEALHRISNRATPTMFSHYKLALMLHFLYNTEVYTTEWIHLNVNHVITSRQTSFHINKTNNLNVGMNALANRLNLINDKIPLELLNKSYNSFKIECKKLFLA